MKLFQATLLSVAFSLGQAEAVEAALADLQKIPVAQRPSIRYLDLGPHAQADDARVLSGHCNQLSRESDITIPANVGKVLRVNLDDYGWKRDVWEKLADADPWYHVRVEVEEVQHWPGGVWPKDGKHYAANSFTYYAKVKKATAVAPWLGLNAGNLVNETQSAAPILRADWFFNQSCTQADRNPGYYDFLGVKDEKTFQKAIGFDVKLADDFGREIREAVADSGVTLQPRAIARHNTLGGGYWRSFDFRIAKDKGNPLRIYGKEIEEAYDATEQYGHLPNGFWATGLFDKQGARQDSAPDFIASDNRSKSNDRRVHVNVSCIRCHSNGGLQDIDAWVRNLLQPPLALQSPDYALIRKLRQQYLRRLEPFIAKDRQVYAEAVMEATGFDTKIYAQKYAEMFERYEDAKVTAAHAARDCGLTEKEFVGKLSAYLKATGGIDPVLSVFLLEGDRRRSLNMKAWEEAFPLAMTILEGVKK